jgi:hypothetical protein
MVLWRITLCYIWFSLYTECKRNDVLALIAYTEYKRMTFSLYLVDEFEITQTYSVNISVIPLILSINVIRLILSISGKKKI